MELYETTYDTIRKANDMMKLTPVHGKDYAEVNQRIKAFRMVYPQGFIKTDIQHLADGLCVFRAIVGVYEGSDMMVLGVGHAYEKEGSSTINRTSYIENCETSAVGRALGMAGFGIDTAVASAEEVANAIEQQNNPDPDILKCSVCGKSISVQEHDYSARVFNKILCRGCQKK